MQIVTSENGNDDTIHIRTGKNLDLSACNVITRVCKLVRYRKVRFVVIDLGNTSNIRDSGLAMLILLRQRAGKMIRQITIINCRPELKSRLSVSALTKAFRIA